MSSISVIVPVYKVEKYLPRCINSILAQTFLDFELILVDDGSPDNCGAICDEYATKDSRIHVIHQENGGLSAARNAGIDWAFANSDSEYLTFIDSDDWIHKEMLARLLQAANAYSVSVSACGYVQTHGEEPESPAAAPPTLWNAADFFMEKNVNATIAVCKLYAKECFREIRYPVGKLHEDEFTTYKILFPAGQVAVIEDALYFYFVNPAGIMKSSWTPRRLDSVAALEEQMKYFKTAAPQVLPNVQRRHLCWLCYHLEAVRQCQLPKAEKIKYLFLLHGKLRWQTLRFGKKCGFTIRTEPRCYELVYPKRIHFYWLAQAAMTQLKEQGLFAVVRSVRHHFQRENH